jgi:hypothetical protein
MRALGIRPTQEALKDISRSYAIIALAHEKNVSTKATRDTKTTLNVRARSSYTILSSIEDPPTSLISIVARACASAGMFHEAQILLRVLHKRVLQCRWEEREAELAGMLDTKPRHH